MPDPNNTRMGGEDEAFHTTRWTEILGARTADEDHRRELCATIMGQYWKPVYGYLRRKGFDNERAKDLTQGFFCEILLERRLLERADRRKGKFRTFVLTALDHYTIDVLRAERANKRMPRQGLVSLDGADGPDVPEPRDGLTPEDAFHHTWAASLIDQVLDEVEAGCREAGLGKHWAVFDTMVVRPLLDHESPQLRQLCDRLGIESETKAYNMNVTVKRRFQAALRRRVRQYVSSDVEVEQEIRDMMEVLSKGSRG